MVATGGVAAGGAGASGGASPGGATSGGASANGGVGPNGGSPSGGASSGGAANGGAGGLSGCNALWQSYKDEFDQARVCTLNLTTKQCSSTWTLNNECGCPIPVNGNTAHYTKALELYQRWLRTCNDILCLVACEPPATEPTCHLLTGELLSGTCEW